MVKADNKAVIYRKVPDEYPIPGEHLVVESKELDENLGENEVLTRNLYFSLDPCKVTPPIHIPFLFSSHRFFVELVP